MPCYDGRDSRESVEVIYKDNPSHIKLMEETVNENRKLEAGLCALITELEKIGLTKTILPKASRSGLIDLVGFWSEHSKEDEMRLVKELHKFSEHEQEILKKLLNNE